MESWLVTHADASHSHAMDEERLSAAPSHALFLIVSCNMWLFHASGPRRNKARFFDSRNTLSPSQPPAPRHKHHRFHRSPRARRAGPPPPWSRDHIWGTAECRTHPRWGPSRPWRRGRTCESRHRCLRGTEVRWVLF